mgnify:CR=1 FL=1
MSLFGDKERNAVEYVADRIEDFEYGEELAKTGTVAGFAGTGAALSSNKVGLSALSFAFGNFAHNVSTELASRNDYEGLLDEVADEEVDELMEEGEFEYGGLYPEDPEESEPDVVLDDDQYELDE